MLNTLTLSGCSSEEPIWNVKAEVEQPNSRTTKLSTVVQYSGIIPIDQRCLRTSAPSCPDQMIAKDAVLRASQHPKLQRVYQATSSADHLGGHNILGRLLGLGVGVLLLSLALGSFPPLPVQHLLHHVLGCAQLGQHALHSTAYRHHKHATAHYGIFSDPCIRGDGKSWP